MVWPSEMTRGVSCWWWVSSVSQAWLPRVLLPASQELNTGGPEGGLSRAGRAGSEVGGTAGLANRCPEVRMWVGGEDKGQVTAAAEPLSSISQIRHLPRSSCLWSFPLETAFEISSPSTLGCPMCGVILPAKQTPSVM